MIKRYQRELLYLVLIAAIAFATCCAWTNAWGVNRALPPPSVHNWLHSQMTLTKTQEQAIARMEAGFAAEQQRLQSTIRNANRELGAALTSERGYSARVAAAVEDIHAAQGELQKVTLQHIFAMQAVLTPEQAQALSRFAADALSHSP